MPKTTTSDVLVVGGGVIGLSIAYQLAGDGLSVTLLERGQPGREASWAGAGILPPGSWYVDHPALDQLAQAAAIYQAEWSRRLLAETGIDDQYWPCGATYVETPENAAFLKAAFARWEQLGITAVLNGSRSDRWEVPSEAQVRNPRRLQALEAACRKRGVQIVTSAPVEGVVTGTEGSISSVVTPVGDYAADNYCFAAGCWTPRVVETAGSSNPGNPIRGQMLLLGPPAEPLDRIIHRYPYYAVPRRDGCVLIGATVESVGFDKQTTEKAREVLLREAQLIDPRLETASLVAHWSGLRPASGDRLPSIGSLPGVNNAWVATGHHRSGLQFSPPTARMISSMIRGVRCELPAEPFDPARFVTQTV